MKDTDGSAKEGTVHKAIRHDSAHKHVSGAAKYVDDIAVPPNTLQILLGQSKFAHAKILSMDLSQVENFPGVINCLLYTSPSPRDKRQSRMPSSA